MTCDELSGLYELYALGAVEAAERREIEEHLERKCPACAAGVARARQLAASLALSAPAAEPPQRLRNRIVTAVAHGPERASSVTWLTHAWATLAVLMLVAVLFFVYDSQQLEIRITALNHRLADQERANAELLANNRMLADALALINQPDARQLVFGRPGQQPPQGRVWVHAQRGVLLLASHLPPAPSGKTYEMWIVPKGAPPIPAGLFNSSPSGEATHVWTEPVNIASAAAVAVTLEPAGGVPAPTSTPIIAAAF
ncbi:MAG TPA: anti-sigma factor [Bryobacterales bacterium]|nr:anti-sigma factor [Bryobacterales bacterium]